MGDEWAEEYIGEREYGSGDDGFWAGDFGGCGQLDYGGDAD